MGKLFKNNKVYKFKTAREGFTDERISINQTDKYLFQVNTYINLIGKLRGLPDLHE